MTSRFGSLASLAALCLVLFWISPALAADYCHFHSYGNPAQECAFGDSQCVPLPGFCSDCNDLQCRCMCDCSGCDCTGIYCEQWRNDCSPNPCQHGGTCTDGFQDYSCTCQAGYFGKSCQNYCAPGTQWNNTVCLYCPIGAYSAGGGVTSCTGTAAGQYVDTIGASTYKTCPTNTFSVAGTSYCLGCGPGRGSLTGVVQIYKVNPARWDAFNQYGITATSITSTTGGQVWLSGTPAYRSLTQPNVRPISRSVVPSGPSATEFNNALGAVNTFMRRQTNLGCTRKNTTVVPPGQTLDISGQPHYVGTTCYLSPVSSTWAPIIFDVAWNSSGLVTIRAPAITITGSALNSGFTFRNNAHGDLVDIISNDTVISNYDVRANLINPSRNGVVTFTNVNVTGHVIRSLDLGTAGVTWNGGWLHRTNVQQAIDCPLCTAGKYSLLSVCTACPVDTYSGIVGASSCTACAGGTSTHGATGSTSASACT